MLLPTLTTRVFSLGRAGRAPAMQVMSVGLTDVALVQGMPSMMIVGVAKSKFKPVKEIVYPPKISPY